MRYKIKTVLSIFFVPKRKRGFISSLPANAKVLDVGCGNHSPEWTKRQRPDLYYVGVDVGDYNTDDVSKAMADEYILTTGEEFANTIRLLPDQFDAAISSHNLEHCNRPMETLDAICSRLTGGGRLYLAFPSERSVLFPSRKGTLNFYDDETHIYLPRLEDVMKRLIRDNRMSVDYVSAAYRPFLTRMIGSLADRIITDRNTRFTWFHYGFETVVWAHKKA